MTFLGDFLMTYFKDFFTSCSLMRGGGSSVSFTSKKPSLKMAFLGEKDKQSQLLDALASLYFKLWVSESVSHFFL